MISFRVVLFALSFVLGILHANADIKEKHGYVDVRPGAHMFWWAMYNADYTSKPLILWLQGGPGGSGTGFGNFGEIGPLDVDQQPRKQTWLNVASLLFIDNPVGTGYSYVDNMDAMTTNVEEIAADLLTTLKAFFKASPEFTDTPFYIFCESYGGKMTSQFAKVILEARNAGDIRVNFQGIALGDSWISPLDSTYGWAPYLYMNSLVDASQRDLIQSGVDRVQDLMNLGLFANSTDEWNVVQEVLENATNGVNFYNILKWTGSEPGFRGRPMPTWWRRNLGTYHGDPLSDLMNGPLKQKLGVPDNVTWGAQSGAVFQYQAGDFMKPVVDVVDELLTTYPTLEVVVYSGQLDLIVQTTGTEQWVHRLRWPGLKPWLTAPRKPLVSTTSSETTVAFVKSYKNFSFYWILDAGHMVPADQPDTALMMVCQVIKCQTY